MVRDEDIARYYDANTGKFLRFGGSGEVAAIHRAIWAPGVFHRRQAFEYLNGLVAEAVRPLGGRFGETLRILDLGCGVGGTATWLHEKLGADMLGVSISDSQVRLARERARRLGCGAHVRFVTGSFEAFRSPDLFHAACAIESFVHCQHPERFLQTAREHVLPGGRLIVCDDFVQASPPPAANTWIRQFRRGWQINQLLSREDFLALAVGQGFRPLETTDLSAHVRPLPWPLLLMLSHLTRLPLPGAYWQNLSGGMALQVCLKRSYSCYHAIVLERM